MDSTLRPRMPFPSDIIWQMQSACLKPHLNAMAFQHCQVAAPVGLSGATRDALAALLPKLRTLAFQVYDDDDDGGHCLEDGLVLALETAEGSAGPFEGEGSRLVHEATCS
eukprot:scaffold232251_cov34-Prasinocladus_malaysianus.AAC.2